MKIKGLLFLFLVDVVGGAQLVHAGSEATLLESLFGKTYRAVLVDLTREQLDERLEQFSRELQGLASTHEEEIALGGFMLGLKIFLRAGHERGMLERYGDIVERAKREVGVEVVWDLPGHEIIRSNHVHAQELWYQKARELAV